MPDKDSDGSDEALGTPDSLLPGIAETAPYQQGSEPTARGNRPAPGVEARLREGETLAGRFVVCRFIARGGMGEVYEADDTSLRARVALKTLLPSLAEHLPSLERFRREVLLARSVSHPNVCRVFEFHSTPTNEGLLHFLTMEFLPGESLATLLKRRGRLTPDEALPLVRQMAAALDAAHEHGVVHRDFKPSNVLLVPPPPRSDSDRLRLVVTDFGIARAIADSRDEFSSTDGTGTTDLLGTPDYMAPEQVSHDHEISGATDLFALGVVLYQMITGKLPFPGDTPLEAALARLRESAPPPQEIQRGIDSAWAGAILRCLERDPAKRPSSASAVVREIEAGPRRPPSSKKQRRTLAVAATVVVAAGAALALLLARLRNTPRASSARPVVAVLSLASQVPPSDAWLGTLLTQLLTNELEETDALRVLPWPRVSTAYRSLAVDADQTLDDAKRQRLYQLLPAQTFVEGSVRCPVGGSVDGCALALDLRDAAGQAKASFEEQFSRRDPGPAIASAGEKLRQSLGVSVTPAQAASLASRRERGPAVLRLLGEGVAAYGRLELSTARDLLQSAASIDPASFDVQRALSKVLQRQGLVTRAREAAERAAEAAKSLSPAMRSEALAQVEWLGTSKTRALAAYKQRFDTHSDDVDLGLALARRLPPAEGLAVLKRVREHAATGPSDLTIDLQEGALEKEQNNLDRARKLIARAQQSALRLKARRELSAAYELQDRVFDAERLASEAGDKQRAAYLHLALVRNVGGNVRAKYIEESLQSFRSIGDRVGIYWSDFQRAADEYDRLVAQRSLEEALAELSAAGELPSVRDQLLAGEIWLGLGDLKKARQSLEFAHQAPDSSLELMSDLPSSREQVAPMRLEMDLLWQQDKLEDAEKVAKERLRQAGATAVSHEEAFLCWLQCERGQLSESVQCYDRLVLKGISPNDDWGQRLAECLWSAGDQGSTDRIAWASKNLGVVAAMTATTQWSANLNDIATPLVDLKQMIEVQRRWHDVPGRLGAELLLGTVELRTSRPGGRRRVEAVLAEARRRGLPLLVRHASSALAKEPIGTASAKP